MKITFAIIGILSSIGLLGQTLVINEVVTKNAKSFAAKEGEYPDWIELYNNSEETIDLSGYSLSDDYTNLKKWSFKNGFLEADSVMVVLASDVSYDSLENNSFETIEDIRTTGWDYADNTDENYPGTSEVRYTLFENSAFGKIEGKPVVAAEIYMGNYAEGVDYSYAGVFVKFDTWNAIVDRSQYDHFRILMYLEKDKKATIGFSQDGLEDWQNHKKTIVGTGDTIWYDIPISKNTGLLDLSILTGLTIVGPDNQIDESFEFILFSIEFSTSLKERFHTNFKLSSSGENLFLSNPEGQIVDNISIPVLLEDVSYGRETDGNENFVIFSAPTPEMTNSGETITGVCDLEISFSQPSGFYATEQEIILSGSSEIRYTTDGSDPTSTSTLYQNTLTIDSNTVLKAACFENGTKPKNIWTNSYFIGYDSKLPVWSISTHPDNFFSEETGIYVFGPEGNWEEEVPHFGANFWQEWERPVHVEFFEDNGEQAFELDCGIQLFGNYSRANPKKSMALFFRSEYGPSKLEYPLFPDYPGLESFDDLILRGSGGDESYLHFRDGFQHELAKDLNFETQKYRPSVLFINGVYWGIHNIREKSNSDYFEENKNIDKTDIDIAAGYYDTRNGDITPFQNMMSDVRADKLSYSEISGLIDVSSFIDYCAYEIYIANYDWPNNNLKYWRQHSTNGKWRWFLYDTDFTTGIYDQVETQANHNSFHKAISFEEGVYWPNDDESTLLLRKLFEFPAFKEAFVNRYCDMMNTLLLPENVFSILQTKVLDLIDLEVPKNRDRWNLGQEEWFDYLAAYKEFWNIRTPYARSFMATELDLEEEVTLTLNISPEGAGYIKLNTIEIDDANWSGIYFKGIPVNIEAVANAGFSFSDWKSSALTLTEANNPNISNFDLTKNNTFTATFTGSAAEQLITISEINYHSPDGFNTQDWVELHNYGTEAMDLSGWKIKDKKLYNGYIFPENTILEAGEYLVLAESKTDFQLLYDWIQPLGPLDFSLSNSGDDIYLYNNRGVLQQHVRYEDKAPWDTYADGEGGALQLLTSGDDVTNPANWITNCIGGSPTEAHKETCSLGTSDDVVTTYTLSPNPAISFIELDNALAISSLEIYTLQGEKVLSSTKHRIDVSGLMSGMYFVSVATANDEKVSFKFVKE